LPRFSPCADGVKGGSTIVMLFEPGRVTWDEDLVNNGKAALETLIKVGSGIGRGTSNP